MELPKEVIPKPIMRDRLAMERTRMANQRTFLSYVRTGIYFNATALGFSYLGDKVRFGWLEWSLSGVGILLVLIGIISFFVMRSKILKTYAEPDG